MALVSGPKACYWCHEPLPPLPQDASYVDELNHYIHDGCREERDESNRRRERLRAGIADGSIDCLPAGVRAAVLYRIKSSGFSRRCPCLYDPAHGFQGYETHSFAGDDEDVDAYDARNSVDACELCGGSGAYDPLPLLLELSDDSAAERWVADELPRSAGPCDQWRGFPEQGWFYDALAYREGTGALRGVSVYNPTRMQGGIIRWVEIAELFRERVQPGLF
jgi:hypothetical protein